MSRFTVVTFNMQFGQVWREHDPDRAPIDFSGCIALLREIRADVMLLQEVEHAAKPLPPDDPSSNYAALRAAFPDYDSFCGHPNSAEPQLPFGIGLAIFARSPLTDRLNVDLPGPDIVFEFEGRPTRPASRSFLSARTVIHGRTVQLFNTHLQAFFMIGASSDDHTTQRDMVVDHLIASKLPTILGGDMNCSPEESTIAQFEAAGYRSAQKTQPTWHRRPYVCDHLFYNIHLEMESVRVVPTGASDHMPLEAIFRL
jgi:endonuclease/exonuclease/phosphatase family metal-dependent hydrolase